ncbi:EamA family transporter [Carnobacteriaceae bacterium zg-ZUI252]|nr:EamA family transporter [Carnobacteriaceae bacterium zg-ZUI252]
MAKFRFSVSMMIFGTIGLFVRYIPLPSGVIALVRGLIGAIFLLAFSRGKLDNGAIRQHLRVLVISGVSIGVEWVLLFEALRQTSVSVATLCYYMAPVFFIVLSRLLFKVQLTKKQLILLAVELVGMFLVTGVLDSQVSTSHLLGMLLALLAAVFYAIIVLCNQALVSIAPVEKTAVQLNVATVVLLPYVWLQELHHIQDVSLQALVLLLVVGVVHTGFAYKEYFGSIAQLPSGVVAVLSYIDPIVAVILSAVVLQEEMTPLMWVGTVLILSVTLGDEMMQLIRRRKYEKN